MKKLFCSLLGATFALASTVTAATATFDANYDNLTTAEVGPPAALGTYDFLAYNSFGVIDGSLAGGIAPHSQPIFVGSNPQASATPSFAVVPPYKTFSLKSFWFGCDADLGQGLANEAVQCTITLAAFKKASNQEVAVASFTFTPPANLVTQVPMIQAVLPNGFENVYNVTNVTNNPSVAVFGVDKLEYTVST